MSFVNTSGKFNNTNEYYKMKTRLRHEQKQTNTTTKLNSMKRTGNQVKIKKNTQTKRLIIAKTITY